MKYLLQKNVLAQFFHSDNMMKIFLTFNKDNMHKSRSVQKAFTLIELLIVIAIIGILTVIFLPTLRGGQAAARDAARKAAVSNVVIAIESIAEGQVTGILAGIPAAAVSICIDTTGSDPVNANIRTALAKPVNVQPSGVALCGGGYYYRTFPTAGTPANYVIISQVEKKDNANVNVVAADQPALDVNFDTIANSILRITGGTIPATGPWYYAVTK